VNSVGRSIQELAVGESADLARSAQADEIAAFVALIGDHNPVHADGDLMSRTRFRAPIVPGMWTASLISVVIGTRLPGPGTIYIAQDLRFLKPVKMGDTITARVEVVEIMLEKNRVRLQTTCINQHGESVLAGEALVLPPFTLGEGARNRKTA